MLLHFIKVLDYPARIAHRHAIRRDGTGNHAACADNRIFSYRHARQDDGSTANSYPVFYFYGFGKRAANFFTFCPVIHHPLADLC